MPHATSTRPEAAPARPAHAALRLAGERRIVALSCSSIARAVGRTAGAVTPRPRRAAATLVAGPTRTPFGAAAEGGA